MCQSKALPFSDTVDICCKEWVKSAMPVVTRITTGEFKVEEIMA